MPRNAGLRVWNPSTNQFSGDNFDIASRREEEIVGLPTFPTSNEEAGQNCPARREAEKWLISALLLRNVAEATISSSRLEIISFFRF